MGKVGERLREESNFARAKNAVAADAKNHGLLCGFTVAQAKAYATEVQRLRPEASGTKGYGEENERALEASSTVRGVLVRWHWQDCLCNLGGDEKFTSRGNFQPGLMLDTTAMT